MVSLAEKMAANVDMSAFGKAEELKKRLWFTVLALIVFRLGTFIPLPGIDSAILAEIFERNSGGILGMFNMFAGGALERMTIFALNIITIGVHFIWIYSTCCQYRIHVYLLTQK